MIVCTACGTVNQEGATYCEKCATRLDAQTQQQVTERRAAHMTTGIRWPVLLSVAIAVLVIILIVLFVLGVL